MANPNRTVAAARAPRKLVCVETIPFGSNKGGADRCAELARADGKIARVIAHKIGPRYKPSTMYRVSFYERANESGKDAQ